MSLRALSFIPSLIAGFVLAASAAAAANSSDIEATDASFSSARVAWTATEDACFAEYKVQFRETGSSTWRAASTIGNPAVIRHVGHWP